MQRHQITIQIDKHLRINIKSIWFREKILSILHLLKTKESVELSLFITTDDIIAQINQQYRDIKGPTDVISFNMPLDETSNCKFILPPDNIIHLGEIVISYPQAVKQAEDQAIETEAELTSLIIHGILHLLGYDHIKLADRKLMNLLELKVSHGLEEH